MDFEKFLQILHCYAATDVLMCSIRPPRHTVALPLKVPAQMLIPFRAQAFIHPAFLLLGCSAPYLLRSSTVSPKETVYGGLVVSLPLLGGSERFALVAVLVSCPHAYIYG
jgi:hypothetical protein